MKLIGNLLLIIGLVVGALAASTSYLAPVGPDAGETIGGATLTSPAGAVDPDADELAELRARYEAGEITAEQYVAERSERSPIIEADTEVDEEALAKLTGEDSGIEYVHVKNFEFARWPYWWAFLLSAGALFAGSMLVRAAAKAEVSAVSPRQGVEEIEGAPKDAIEKVRTELNALHADLPGMASDDARLDEVVRRLGDLQIDVLPVFIDGRPRLIAKLGLGGYAELMDRFAAMERQINRAWSAAADRHLPESQKALELATHLAPEVIEKMPSE